MVKYALAQGGIVFSTVEVEDRETLFEMFPEVIASQYIECSNPDATAGWKYNGRDFIHPDAPAYVLALETTSITPGSTVVINLRTANVEDDTVVPYTISGVEAADLNLESLEGEFIVSEEAATVELTISSTLEVPGDGKTVKLQLDEAYPFVEFVIAPPNPLTELLMIPSDEPAS